MITPFKKIATAIVVLTLFATAVLGQKSKPKSDPEIKIPMEPSYWDYSSPDIEFVVNRGVSAARVKRGAPLYLKNQIFSDGTIEYDVEFGKGGFPGISFRMSPDRKNGDNFYLRYFGTTSRESRTSIQYTAEIDGMSIWDLTDEYQAGATLRVDNWNHVKLVVSGKQMKAYVNDMTRPSLIVPELEGNQTSGLIFFAGGDVTIANVVIKPNATEGISPETGYISTYNDTRYIRNWYVNQPEGFPYGKEVVMQLPYMGGTPVTPQLPDSATKWTSITTENRGLLNLTRKFGAVKNNERKLVWLKTTLQSAKAQERILNLGFSDEVWVFINGQFLFADKNHFGTPGQKFPRGRCTIENATVRLPLNEGKNEILIAVANYFYGWGVIARLDDTDGIKFGETK